METHGYFDLLEAIRGVMIEWLRVQRKTTGSLFKETLRGLVVLPKAMTTRGHSIWRHFGNIKTYASSTVHIQGRFTAPTQSTAVLCKGYQVSMGVGCLFGLLFKWFRKLIGLTVIRPGCDKWNWSQLPKSNLIVSVSFISGSSQLCRWVLWLSDFKLYRSFVEVTHTSHHRGLQHMETILWLLWELVWWHMSECLSLFFCNVIVPSSNLMQFTAFIHNGKSHWSGTLFKLSFPQMPHNLKT